MNRLAAASLLVVLAALLLPAPVAAEGLIRRLLAKNHEEAHNAAPGGRLLAQDPIHGQDTFGRLRGLDERRGRLLKSNKTKSPKSDKTKSPKSNKNKSPKDRM